MYKETAGKIPPSLSESPAHLKSSLEKLLTVQSKNPTF